ncbi:hypothetical protein K438DRAFT_1783907 [Mycena galopus ATCC 62051]|nr:hypothetical protein K438DRAFT_1783907 [Mycena galopus ATCC 62051]
MPPIRRSASEGAHPDAYPNLQILKHDGYLKKATKGGVESHHRRVAGCPLTSSGSPVAPSRLLKTIRAAYSPMPTCFFNKPAKYVNPIINVSPAIQRLLNTFSERQSSLAIPVLPSSSTPSSSPKSPSTPAASAAGSSSSDGWSGVRRLLNYRYDPEPDPFAFGIPTSVMDFTGTPIKKGIQIAFFPAPCTKSTSLESPSPSLLMAQLDKSCAADSPSSSSSSGGHDPMYGEYSYVHHDIPLPTHPLPGDSTALNLWLPPSPSRLVPPPKSTVAPAVQLSPEVELLTSSTGLGVDKFWALWEYCPLTEYFPVLLKALPARIKALPLSISVGFPIVDKMLITPRFDGNDSSPLITRESCDPKNQRLILVHGMKIRWNTTNAEIKRGTRLESALTRWNLELPRGLTGKKVAAEHKAACQYLSHRDFKDLRRITNVMEVVQNHLKASLAAIPAADDTRNLHNAIRAGLVKLKIHTDNVLVSGYPLLSAAYFESGEWDMGLAHRAKIVLKHLYKVCKEEVEEEQPTALSSAATTSPSN